MSEFEEKVYELREQGLSYEKIREYFIEKDKSKQIWGVKKGKPISLDAIIFTCKNVYKKLGKEEPTTHLNSKNTKEYQVSRARVSDDEIFKLREQGMTFTAMSRYFSEKGISITRNTLSKRSKEIYKKLNKEEPIAFVDRHKKSLSKISDETLFNLREQQYSYDEITTYLNKKGINVSRQYVCNRIHSLYSKIGKPVPDAKNKSYTRPKKYATSNNIIYELRELGFSYKQISIYMAKRGEFIGKTAVGQRCKEIYASLGKEEPMVNNYTRKPLAELEEKLKKLEEKKQKSGKLLEDYSKLSKANNNEKGER